MLEIKNLPRIPQKVIIPVAAGVMAMSAVQAKAAKPDTFKKTTVTATTNVPNNVASNDTTTPDITTINNQLDLIIPQTSPMLDYYNNLSIQDRGNVRREATENVQNKIYGLMVNLANQNALDKSLVNIINGNQLGGLKTDFEIKIDEINEIDDGDLTKIKDETIKDIVNTQTIAKVLNEGVVKPEPTKEQIMEAIFSMTEKKVQSVIDYKTAIQGSFNSYYDTPMGLLILPKPKEVHNFFQDAMGKTIEEFTDELIEAPTIEKRREKINDFGEKITENEQSCKDDIKNDTNDKLNEVLTGVITTFFNIEQSEKNQEGITPQNLQEFFGENPETVTVKEFASSLQKAYQASTTGMNTPTNDGENLKPGRHRYGLPYITKINGKPAMIQKYVNIKPNGTKEYQYYDIYNNGREVKM